MKSSINIINDIIYINGLCTDITITQLTDFEMNTGLDGMSYLEMTFLEKIQKNRIEKIDYLLKSL